MKSDELDEMNKEKACKLIASGRGLLDTGWAW